MNGYGFFALAFRQKYIARWSLMRNSQTESLSSHSMETAMIAHCLALINKEVFGGDADPDRTAVFALFHDCTEVLSGDMPSPIKYYSGEMRKTYAKIEKKAAEQLLSKLPPELSGAYAPFINEEADDLTLRLVKTADKLCALIKCIEEENCGNNEFAAAKKATEKALESYRSDELDYFMKNFIPAFSLPIDEL